jgi:predicted ATPase
MRTARPGSHRARPNARTAQRQQSDDRRVSTARTLNEVTVKACRCEKPHDTRLVVLTGGPGAGKTALLELVRKSFCSHVLVLPEAASIIFGGGFPRDRHAACQRAAQRAIYHVERELEASGLSHAPAVVMCDRGTLDGLAYWPGTAADFFTSLGTTVEAELTRYHAVIHLRTPGDKNGYDQRNPLRIESATDAAEIDARILKAWEAHPRRYVVPSSVDFLEKCAAAIGILHDQVPACCRQYFSIATSVG